MGTASQQLGHSSASITQEFDISKPEIAADVAHVLEEVAEASGELPEGSTQRPWMKPRCHHPGRPAIQS